MDEHVVSYCAQREDWRLYRLLSDVEAGFYIDVGAMDPEYESVTKMFYDRGWSGINIEPRREMLLLLAQERPRDRNLQLAVAETEGEVVCYCYKGLSTLCRETSVRVAAELGVAFVERTVKTMPLSKIAAELIPGGRDIHFVKIDVETYEKQVLNSFDFSLRPWVFCIESTFPYTVEPLHQNWEPILLDNGYRFLETGCAVNRYYVANERFDERSALYRHNAGIAAHGVEEARETRRAIAEEKSMNLRHTAPKQN